MSFSFVRFCCVFLLAATSLFLFSCDTTRPASEESRLRFQSVIPKPVSAVLTGNAFVLTEDTKIVVSASDRGLENVARFINEKLGRATGFDLPVSTGNAGDETIFLTLRDDPALGEEGYELTVEGDRVIIAGNTPQGVFWGAQTLRQLLPEQIEGSSTQSDMLWEIATGTIRDQPVYGWRGSMLDVARHFFGVDDIKRYIDLISLYKMNVLHMHLSDDQGWRIQIDSWPNLHTIGSLTQVGGGKGGYYTKEDYRDIVDYAAQHYITIIPEIDMPGHINAALVSYNELLPGPSINTEPGSRPRPKAGEVYTGIQVGFSTLDYKKEITFRFVADVWREIAEMTPGPYLHIGGDEAAVTKKPDYIAFINRFKEIFDANNKRMVGWEEIAQGDIDSTVIVQQWHSPKWARLAAEKGASIVLSPAKKVYLDMQYDSTSRLGLHWAAYIEVDSAYMWDPSTYLPEIDPDRVLGVEAPLWSETVVTMDDIEYMLFPRMPGVAEVSWTPRDGRSWDEYKIRLARHGRRWDLMKIDYYKSPKVKWD